MDRTLQLNEGLNKGFLKFDELKADDKKLVLDYGLNNNFITQDEYKSKLPDVNFTSPLNNEEQNLEKWYMEKYPDVQRVDTGRGYLYQSPNTGQVSMSGIREQFDLQSNREKPKPILDPRVERPQAYIEQAREDIPIESKGWQKINPLRLYDTQIRKGERYRREVNEKGARGVLTHIGRELIEQPTALALSTIDNATMGGLKRGMSKQNRAEFERLQRDNPELALAGSVLGFVFNPVNKAFTKLNIGGRTVGKATSAVYTKAVESKANKALYHTANFFNEVAPKMVDWGVRLGTIQSIRTVVDPSFDEYTTEEKIKTVSDSALTGMALAGAFGTVSEFVGKPISNVLSKKANKEALKDFTNIKRGNKKTDIFMKPGTKDLIKTPSEIAKNNITPEALKAQGFKPLQDGSWIKEGKPTEYFVTKTTPYNLDARVDFYRIGLKTMEERAKTNPNIMPKLIQGTAKEQMAIEGKGELKQITQRPTKPIELPQQSNVISDTAIPMQAKASSLSPQSVKGAETLAQQQSMPTGVENTPVSKEPLIKPEIGIKSEGTEQKVTPKPKTKLSLRERQLMEEKADIPTETRKMTAEEMEKYFGKQSPKKTTVSKITKTEKPISKEKTNEMLNTANKQLKEIEDSLGKLPLNLQFFAKDMLKKYKKIIDEAGNKGLTKTSTDEIRKLIDFKENASTREKEVIQKVKDQIKEKEEQRVLKKLETEEKKDLLNTIKDVSSKIKSKKYRAEYSEALTELIGNVYPKALGMSGKKQIELQKAREYFQNLQEEDSSYVIPHKVQQSLTFLNKKNIKDMTQEQVKDLKGLIDRIVALEKLKTKIINRGKVKDFNKTKEFTINLNNEKYNELSKRKQKSLLKVEERKAKGGAISDIENFFKDTLTAFKDPYTSAFVASGGETENPIFQILHENPRKATHDFYKQKQAVERYISNLFKNIDNKQSEKVFESNWKNFRKREALKLPDYKGNVELSSADKISLYLHEMADETNRISIRNGFTPEGTTKTYKGLTDNDISTILDTLTPKEKSVAEGIFKLSNDKTFKDKYGDFPSFKERLNETSYQLDGIKIADVEKYTRIMRDKKYLNEQFNFQGSGGVENVSMTKKRVNAKTPLILEDPIKMVERLNRDTGNYHSYASVLRDMKKFLGDKDIRASFEKRFGSGFNKYYREYISVLDGTHPDKTKAGLPHKVLGNIQGAKLANPTTWFKQIASLPLVNHVLPPVTPVDKGYKYYIELNNKELADFIEEYTPTIHSRAQGYSLQELKGMEDIQQSNILTSAIKPLKNISTAGISTFDMSVMKNIVRRAWAKTSIDNPNLNHKSKEFKEKVADLATLSVEITQPNYTITDRSLIRMRKDMTTKLLTAFTTVPLKQHNMFIQSQVYNDLAKKYKKTDPKKSKQYSKKARKIYSGFAEASLILATIGYGYDKWRKRDNDFLGEFIKYSTSWSFGGMVTEYDVRPLLISEYNQLKNGLGRVATAILEEKDSEKRNNEIVRGLKNSIFPFLETLGIPAPILDRNIKNLIMNVNPDLYLDLYSPTRTSLYDNFWKSNNKNERLETLGTLYKDGVTLNSLKNSARNREKDVDEIKSKLGITEKETRDLDNLGSKISKLQKNEEKTEKEKLPTLKKHRKEISNIINSKKGRYEFNLPSLKR